MVTLVRKTLWIFAREGLSLICALASYFVMAFVFERAVEGLYVAAAFGALFLIGIVASCLKFGSTELTLTNLKLICKKGVFSSKTIEIILSNIDCVEVRQSLFGRIFKFGRVQIITRSKEYAFKGIDDPQTFVTAVNAQTAKLNAQRTRIKNQQYEQKLTDQSKQVFADEIETPKKPTQAVKQTVQQVVQPQPPSGLPQPMKRQPLSVYTDTQKQKTDDNR